MARATAKAKVKAKRKVKAAKKVVKTSVKKSVRKVAAKTAPRSRAVKAKSSSLVKELGALADKITNLGKSMLDQGSEKAGDLARAVERGGAKIGNEIASIKRAALKRVKS